MIARNITVSFGGQLVLDGVDVAVHPGQRIGLVAPNGTGKSTLLAVLDGSLVPGSGTVERMPRAATIGRLPQEPERLAGETVRAYAARRTGVTAAQHALDTATEALARGESDAADRYDAALTAWLTLGAADLDVRLETVAAKLGLDGSRLDLTTTALSGGEMARVSLASILLSQFDVFLLDEPTNDLDLDGLAILEGFVLGLDAATIVVSHDRTFLERIVTDVIEIDRNSRRATAYGGGWNAYLETKANALRLAQEAWEAFDQQRSALKQRADAQRRFSEAGAKKAKRKPPDNDKAARGARIEAAEQGAAAVSRTKRQLERLDEVDKPWENWKLQLDLASAPRSGSTTLRLVRAVVERGTFRLGPIDLELGWGERLAIVGPNGSGKSTLIDALLGRIALSSGERWVGPSVVVGEIEQRRTGSEELAIDSFRRATGLLEPDARTLLAKFGLGGDQVTRSTDTWSAGERTRFDLARLMAVGTTLLVLDEPTNHLDLEAIEELERALASWTGSLIVVTHDRQFATAVRVDHTLRLGDDDS